MGWDGVPCAGADVCENKNSVLAFLLEMPMDIQVDMLSWKLDIKSGIH